MRLSILEYMRYLDGSTHSKCVVEGENVLNAGHLILGGKTEVSSEFINIYGLCLQSSAINSDPHEIKGTLTIEDEILKIKEMHCSCKAGNSGKCKHVSALLVKCIREDIENLEQVSSTDIKCVWSTQKVLAKERYKPVPVEKMPCFVNKMKHCDVSTNDEAIRSFFCQNLPNSAISQHRKGRRSISSSVQSINNDNLMKYDHYQTILDNACQSVCMMYLSSTKIHQLKDCCANLYASILNEDIEITINVPQRSLQWMESRKYRITGSRCYEIYTYSKEDWTNKTVKYFFPAKINNKFIKHGIQWESAAREAFVQVTGMEVVDCGMVVSAANKWLGYSPDGIVIFQGRPIYLLEIKCVFEGKSKTVVEAIEKSTYIIRDGEGYKLKKSHKYYGQIQMGMALLNLPKTAFVVYASHDNSLLIVDVDFDFEFVLNMLITIKHNYFENMLHVLCENQSRLH